VKAYGLFLSRITMLGTVTPKTALPTAPTTPLVQSARLIERS
jgi:hypothetical protein